MPIESKANEPTPEILLESKSILPKTLNNFPEPTVKSLDNLTESVDLMVMLLVEVGADVAVINPVPCAYSQIEASLKLPLALVK